MNIEKIMRNRNMALIEEAVESEPINQKGRNEK